MKKNKIFYLFCTAIILFASVSIQAQKYDKGFTSTELDSAESTTFTMPKLEKTAGVIAFEVTIADDTVDIVRFQGSISNSNWITLIDSATVAPGTFGFTEETPIYTYYRMYFLTGADTATVSGRGLYKEE